MATKKKAKKNLHYVIERTFRYELRAESIKQAISNFLNQLETGTVEQPVDYTTNIVCQYTGEERGF